MEGNTKTISHAEDTGKAATYWFITLHVPNERDCAEELKRTVLELAKLKSAKWVVAQGEETKTGGKHIQACMGYTRTERMFTKLRRMFPGVHVEICKNWKYAQSYCSKEESRICEPIFWPEDIKAEVNPWQGGKSKDVQRTHPVRESKVKYEQTQEYKDWCESTTWKAISRAASRYAFNKCNCDIGPTICLIHKEKNFAKWIAMQESYGFTDEEMESLCEPYSELPLPSEET